MGEAEAPNTIFRGFGSRALQGTSLRSPHRQRTPQVLESSIKTNETLVHLQDTQCGDNIKLQYKQIHTKHPGFSRPELEAAKMAPWGGT